MGKYFTIFCIFLSSFASAAQIVSEGDAAVCERLEIPKGSEVRLYKDPDAIFRKVALLAVDPILGWQALEEEDILIGRFKDLFQFQRLSPPRRFENFGEVELLYQMVEPRLKPLPNTGNRNPVRSIVYVNVCGEGAYCGTPGFVLLEDIKSQPFISNGSPPPSTPGNEIPIIAKR